MSKPVSPDAFTYATQRTPMKLEYFIDDDTGIVEVPTEFVILEYFEKMREGDFLILNNALDEFVQVLRGDQDSYFLEYQANDIQFDADPESVSRTTAVSAFVSFLLYGPNSVEFQSISAWVKTEIQTMSDITHDASTENSMPWRFATSESKHDTDLEEIQARTNFALRCITECKIQKATILDLGGCNLTAIPAKVRQLVWLKSLYLGNNNNLGREVSDLAPLTALVNLRTLNISDTQVSDLTPLTGLVNLKWLNCCATPVRDLTPISNLVNLQTLRAVGAQISDLTPVAGLVNLRTLNISNTPVSDLTPLTALMGPQSMDIDISHTLVSDLTPLASLVNLRSLNITDTLVSDLTPLASLVGLRTLLISGTPPVSNLGANAWPFEGRLEPLVISGTLISDLAPLAGLLSLETLDVSGTQVRDLTPLAGILGLRTLVISGTPVSDLAPLTGLLSLETLDVSRTQVRDLAPLPSLVNLRRFTPSVGADVVPRYEFRALEAIAEVARAGKGKKLGQIAKERFQKTADISYQLSCALRLLSQHDPYPRDAPLWQYVERMQWPTRISPNAELVLHKVDLVYKVLAASARWRATAQEEKLQLQMGDDLPLPDYLLTRLKAMSLTLVRDLIATTRTVLKAGDLDQEDFELLKHYLDWYGLNFQRLLVDVKIAILENVKISTDLSMQSISDLGLTVRATNCLTAEGIETVGDLVRRSENYLLKTPNLGRKSLNEIRETLVALGLQLAGD